MSIPWIPEYELGFTQIDAQHHEFVNALNELYSVIGSVPTSAAVTPIFEKIDKYINYHFQTEENYFKEFNYSGAAEHIAKHQEFGEKIKDLKKQLNNNEIAISFELADFLENWLLDHLNTYDKLYIECFHQHGLK